MGIRKRIKLRMNEPEYRQEDIKAYTHDSGIGESIIGWDDFGNPYIVLCGGFFRPIRGFLEYRPKLIGTVVTGNDGVRWIYAGHGKWEKE